MKVILVPKYMTNEELSEVGIVPTATVEAEYGNMVIRGEEVTLAHHTKEFQDNPAPCNAENVPVLGDDATIVVSHLDLDTLGGIAALMGRKKDDPAFWQAAEFIDLNGPHNLYKVDEDVRDRYVAYECYQATNRMPRFAEITDVTDIVMSHLQVIDRAIDGDKDLIKQGKEWEKKTNEIIEKCLIFENDNVRVFNSPEGTFCSAAYYSPNLGKVVPCTVTLNGKFHSITAAMADGGKEMQDCNCRDMVQALWGDEAGGHAGIAGSPRGQIMTTYDLWRAAKYANDAYNVQRGTKVHLNAPKFTLQQLQDEVNEYNNTIQKQ